MEKANVCPHCKKEIDSGATKCPHCQSDLRSWPRRHPILTGIAGIFVFGCVLSAIGSATNANPSSGNVTNGSSGSSANDMSPAEKLARVETQDTNPPASIVALYDAMLTKLATKCPNDSRLQLAGYVFTMKKDIVQKTTYLEDGDSLYHTIPNNLIGALKCDEAAAMFVTLMNDPNTSSQ